MVTTPVAVAGPGAATLSAHVHPHRLIFRPPLPNTGLPPSLAASASLPTAARVEKVGSFASRTSTWPSRSWTKGWSLMRRQPCIKASLADLDAALVVKNKAVDIAQELKGTSIFLIGMQCAMKTNLGKVLADALRYYYFDSDSLVIQAAGGESAAKSYTQRDEGFQNAETEVLKQLSSMGRLVVCTGDGAVKSSKTLAFLRHGISVWVDVPLNIIAKDAMEFPGQHLFSREISASDTSSEVLNKLVEVYQDQQDGFETADAIISVQKVAAHLGLDELEVVTPEAMALEALKEIEKLTSVKKMMEEAARPF